MRPPARRTALRGRGRADAARLRMQAMLGGVRRLDRKERAGPHMQGHLVDHDPALREAGDEASVKCNPAVGAATEPSACANKV